MCAVIKISKSQSEITKPQQQHLLCLSLATAKAVADEASRLLSNIANVSKSNLGNSHGNVKKERRPYGPHSLATAQC